MKKTSPNSRSNRSAMRKEYEFDYRRARPNRFAPLLKGRAVAVVLDPEVASVFGSSESVNAFLRSVIKALPRKTKTVSLPKK
jgi:hypothetical protein